MTLVILAVIYVFKKKSARKECGSVKEKKPQAK
jgi:hypothetical protein